MNYTAWKNYFEINQSHFSEIDWNTEDKLTPEEKSVISSSLQQFQRGENSEGKHLFKYAKNFPDPEYLECIKLFIREEQMHARVLGQFMEKNNISKICGHWVDDIFRWLRKIAGIQNTIIVLVTAEIIAKIYYKALMEATTSRLLATICAQILKDEDEHIGFQSYTLSELYKKKKYFGKIFGRIWHLILMLGTILVVWMNHRKVLKEGGFYFSRYCLETVLVFFNTDEIIKNKVYPKGKFDLQVKLT